MSQIKLPEEKQPKPIFNQSVAVRAIIREHILAGHSREKILRELTHGVYGYEYTEQTAIHLIAEVNTSIKKEAEELKSQALEEIAARFNDLYTKLYEKEDYSNCKDVLREMAKLFGLSDKNKVEIDKPDEKITISFS